MISTIRAAICVGLWSAWLFDLPAQEPIRGADDRDGVGSVEVYGTDPNAPLRLTAERRGLRLLVHVDVEPGWHLYGRDVGGGQPFEIEISDGSAFAVAGALVAPMDASGEITGRATLELPLLRVRAGATLVAKARFMVCDPLQCLPPMEVRLVGRGGAGARAEPLRVLLVGVDRGERTERIARHLGDRGLSVTITTYTDVARADCEAHDVVLADSPTFRECRGASADATKFPDTTTPIVAVGFLGTRLLEAQRVTMASGYI